jgi:hypothetical protein
VEIGSRTFHERGRELALEQFQEYGLENILGILTVSRHAVCRVINKLAMFSKQFLEFPLQGLTADVG